MPSSTQNDSLSRNSATGELIERFPLQSEGEIEQLLTQSRAAFQNWRALSLAERADVYRRFASTLRNRSDQIAPVITAEMGKPLRDARGEIEQCAESAEWFAEHGPAFLADEEVAVDGSDHAYVSYLPLGSILGVMPWNFPLWQAIRACVPVMLAGNGFILKPAPNTMRSAYMMSDAWEAAGLPKGLLSILNTDNEGIARIIADRRVVGASVTGSTRAGSAVAAQAGKFIKPSLLELGGADPFIVLADADIDKAVNAGILARYNNSGQICINAKRFILEAPIAEEYTTKFVSAARALKVGDPFDAATDLGPIARGDLRDTIHDQVTRTLASGATLLAGGHVMDGPGFFYETTVLGNVEPGMAAFDEEIFGPVAALTRARDFEHAIELANRSDYGLSGNLWTSDLARAQTIARRLETGGVFVNGYSASNARVPVGGVKNSGYGRELSHFGVREFTNAQTVWIKKV